MFFDRSDIDVKILSVLHLNWKSMHAYAAERDFCALSYRYSGGADFTHNGITRHVASKEFVYIPSGFDYHIDSEEEELFVVHFKMNGLSENDIDTFAPSNIQYFERKLNEMYISQLRKKTGYYYSCKAAFYNILEHIAEEKCENKSELKFSLINDAADYIHEHYADSGLTVDFLAKRANMSDTYFRKLFTEQYGQTPLKYINALRIERAAELLMSGYYSVCEVAEKCGFDNAFYFSNVFLKATGKRPMQYKRR